MTYLIVGSGNLTDTDKIIGKIEPYNHIIAVDGGYDRCATLGITPNLVIGDFDSTAQTVFSCEQIRVKAEKDEADLKLAVEYALEHGATKIMFLCVTGGRLDHFLNNLSILEYVYSKGIDGVVIDEMNRIYVQIGRKYYNNLSRYVSVIPITEEIVCTSEHLKYPMEHRLISRHDIISISNECLGANFMLDIEQGTGFVILAD